MSFFKKRILSFKYAFTGIKWAFASQHNLWIHLFTAICAIILALYFDISRLDWIIIIACITTIFSVEFINTAIEWLVDSIYKEQNPVAGKIKDVSAAAVLVVAMGVAAIGVMVFYPYVEVICK